MGLKQGYFYTDGGDLVTVSFYGEKVETGEIRLANSPVIIQMDGGGGEYIPVQYATASIACISNNLELFDLCAQDPLDVAVEVYNRTTEKVIFAGYVTPNVFNQSIDELNTVVTIECVDWLGIAKYVLYERDDTEYAVYELSAAVYTIIGRISTEAKIVLSDFIRISNGSQYLPEHVTEGDGHVVLAKTDKYHLLTMSDSFFYDNPANPTVLSDGNIALSRNAITSFSALEMLAKTFRASWVQVGDTIMLVDVIGRAERGEEIVVDIQNYNNRLAVGEKHVVKNTTLCAQGSTLSILPTYKVFSYTRAPGEYPIVPSFDEFRYLKAVRSYHPELIYIDNELTYNHCWHLESKILNGDTSTPTTVSLPEETTCCFLGCKNIRYRDNTAAERPVDWGRGWDNYIRLLADPIQSPSISFKSDYIIPTLDNITLCYKLELEAAYTKVIDSYYPKGLESGDLPRLYIVIKIGDLFYDRDAQVWVNERVINPIYFHNSSGEWKSDIAGIDGYNAGVVAAGTKNGAMEIELFCRNQLSAPIAVYIKKLLLTVAQVRNVSDSYSDQSFMGDIHSSQAYEDVVFPITFGAPSTERCFSEKVDGVRYVLNSEESAVAPYAGKLLGHYFNQQGEDVEYDLTERIERMANLGDRKEYTFNLKDPHNAISPLDTFTSSLWKGNKICVAYQRDVKKDAINVTLN